MQQLRERRLTNTPQDVPQVLCNCGLSLNREETPSSRGLLSIINKMNIGEFIKKKRQEKNLSLRELAKKANLSHTYIARLEQNKLRPTFEKLQIILEALNVSIKEFFGIDRSMPLKKERLIPIISWVQAGSWHEVCDVFPPGQADEWILTDLIGENMFALIVKGDSMEPEFVEGDIIIVNPHIEPKPGNYVIVKNEDNSEATFKQLDKYGDILILHPLNPKYPDIELTPRHKVRIIGKLVEKRKRY